jgi:hypothetical protein
MNKLSLVGMQLPENIRRISTFRAKALRLELYNCDRISSRQNIEMIYSIATYHNTYEVETRNIIIQYYLKT